MIQYRYEKFGGIISMKEPSLLAFVDQQFMKSLNLSHSSLWDDDSKENDILSAPVEAHFAVTNSCLAGCAHCYSSSVKNSGHSLLTADVKAALEKLSQMGVFHVAFGGGEPLLRGDLIELGDYAVSLGLTPTLTTSGTLLTQETAKRLQSFHRVNVSMDGIGKYYTVFRQIDSFGQADNAIRLLIKNNINTGINTLVGKDNFDHLPELFNYAKNIGADEVNVLRLKPSGRAKQIYDAKKATYDQNIQLMPMLASLTEKYNLMSKIDCSLVPMCCYHNPDIDYLKKISMFGCEPANVTIGIASNGFIHGCSFLPKSNLTVSELDQNWDNHPYFNKFRNWIHQAPEPCKSCNYLSLCKGGCKAVALAKTGSSLTPDPECPRVVDYQPNQLRE